MFTTRLRALLRPLMAAVPLLLTSPLHANDASWQQTLLAARGQTVYFNAWGAAPRLTPTWCGPGRRSLASTRSSWCR